MNRASLPDVLVTWAQLAQHFCWQSPTWEPVEAMLEAATADANKVESTLRSLLKRSDQLLAPLCDPLRANVGLNRWLLHGREEAYSDWLAWVLQQLDSRQIVRLLRIDDERIAKYCRTHRFSVKREHCIPDGRLDLVIEFGQGREGAILVIEVKTTSADEADTGKQKGYCKWLEGRRVRYKPRPILLVTDAEEGEYEGFAVLAWSGLCIGLRGMLVELQSRRRIGLVRTAMVVAFIGAVESNLLHLVTPTEKMRGQCFFYSRTAEHLKQGLPQTRGRHG